MSEEPNRDIAFTPYILYIIKYVIKQQTIIILSDNFLKEEEEVRQ